MCVLFILFYRMISMFDALKSMQMTNSDDIIYINSVSVRCARERVVCVREKKKNNVCESNQPILI